jgi:beta-mannosidase
MWLKRNVLFIMALILFFSWGCQKKVKDINLMVQKEINEGWTFRQANEGQWLPATVPGTVHTDLLDNMA